LISKIYDVIVYPDVRIEFIPTLMRKMYAVYSHYL
jgi:hypothetical protein